MVVQAAVQSEYESRVNLNHVVISATRPRELPLRGQGRRFIFRSTCSGLFFCSLEALRQLSVEGGLAAELLDQCHTRYRLTVREL